jgi:hypothetical protein
MFKDSKTRWLVTAFAAAALAVTLAAPAGAWPVAEGSDNVNGSMPPQEVQNDVLSNTVHEGVQADRRLGTTSIVPTPVSDAYVPGVTDSSIGVMEQVRQNARDDVVTDKAAPAVTDTPTAIPYLSQGEGVPASFGETYVPGVTDSTTGVYNALGIETPTVVAADTSDDSFSWNSDFVIALSAALATALLMTLGTFALVSQRRRRVAL